MQAFFDRFAEALLGAVVSLILPPVIFWVLQKRSTPGKLTGDWCSSYQGIEEPEGTWVTEKVRIGRTLTLSSSGTLRSYYFKNSDSSRGYDYLATGALSKEHYITGDWTSRKPDNSSNCGVFVLTIVPRGNAMYGYWAGSDTAGARRYGRWVLVKDAEDAPDLEYTKDLLTRMRTPGPPLEFGRPS